MYYVLFLYMCLFRFTNAALWSSHRLYWFALDDMFGPVMYHRAVYCFALKRESWVISEMYLPTRLECITSNKTSMKRLKYNLNALNTKFLLFLCTETGAEGDSQTVDRHGLKFIFQLVWISIQISRRWWIHLPWIPLLCTALCTCDQHTTDECSFFARSVAGLPPLRPISKCNRVIYFSHDYFPPYSSRVLLFVLQGMSIVCLLHA